MKSTYGHLHYHLHKTWGSEAQLNNSPFEGLTLLSYVTHSQPITTALATQYLHTEFPKTITPYTQQVQLQLQRKHIVITTLKPTPQTSGAKQPQHALLTRSTKGHLTYPHPRPPHPLRTPPPIPAKRRGMARRPLPRCLPPPRSHARPASPDQGRRDHVLDPDRHGAWGQKSVGTWVWVGGGDEAASCELRDVPQEGACVAGWEGVGGGVAWDWECFLWAGGGMRRG